MARHVPVGVVDEVHDRDIDTDFVLLLIKMSMRRHFRGKLILMSATLDPALLQSYFTTESINPTIPLIRSSFQMYNVNIRLVKKKHDDGSMA